MAYASPYYDPVKAHEYYMEHRKLKGTQSKTSTQGLNTTGRTAANLVKQNLNKEQKETAKKNTEQAKAAIKEYTAKTNAQIKDLRNKLKSMSKAQKKANKDTINAQIKALREANTAKRKELTAGAKSQNESLKTEYQSKYVSELKNIKDDEGMRQQYDRKSTGGLNEEGKEEAKKIREKLQAEQKKEIESYAQTATSEIEMLSRKLKRMGSGERKALGSRFNDQIQKLREENQNKRKELTDSYNEKYYSELDKLKKDSKYSIYS